MSTELSIKLKCLCIRNGVEIWVEEARALSLMDMLTKPNPPDFIRYEGRLINRKDLVGIFDASDMEDFTNRKNNRWKCKSGNWHDKAEKCDCCSAEERARNLKIAEAMAKCGKCQSGYVVKNTTAGSVMIPCECIKNL